MKRDSISAYPALRGEKTLRATFRLFCRPLKNSIAFRSRRGSVFFFGVEDYIIIIESHINLLQVGEAKCQEK